MSQNDEVLANFCSIMNANEDEAKFYLEATGYDLNAAMNALLQSRGAEDDNFSPDEFQTATSAMNSSNVAPNINTDTQPPSKPNRFATLNTLNPSKPKVANDDGSSSEEEGQAFFVGGGGQQGQQVLGPPKRREHGHASKNLIHSVFKSAQEHGAEVVNRDEASSSHAGSSGTSFRGTGFRLGDSVTDTSVPIVSPTEVNKKKENYEVNMKMWKNGISWNDGDLIPYDNPASAQILKSLSEGSIPVEILREAKGREVDLLMEDHRGEEFKAPPLKPFAGKGEKLGEQSGTSDFTSSVAVTSHTPLPQGVVEVVNINNSLPTTQLQIRLSDGGKLVAKLNLTNTVADIRNLINTHHPPSSSRNYDLMTTFPRCELNDESKTIEEAQLKNAAILQRFK